MGSASINSTLFQKNWVGKAQEIGGFASQFKPSKVKTMKVNVGSGLWMTFVQRSDHVRSEIYIYKGPDRYHETEDMYKWFLQNRESIDASYGPGLEWNPEENRNACRIEHNFPGFDIEDQYCWDEYCQLSIHAMNNLFKALKPYL